MPQNDRNARFFNYPDPKPLEQPYQTPPPLKNPIIKGALLYHISNLYGLPIVVQLQC
jgi:hypothetical protein